MTIKSKCFICIPCCQNRDADASPNVHGPPRFTLAKQEKKLNSWFIILRIFLLKQMNLFWIFAYASSGVLCIQFSILQAISSTWVPSVSSVERHRCWISLSEISNFHVHYSMKRASVFNSMNIHVFVCLMKNKTMSFINNCIIFYFIYDVSCW